MARVEELLVKLCELDSREFNWFGESREESVIGAYISWKKAVKTP